MKLQMYNPDTQPPHMTAIFFFLIINDWMLIYPVWSISLTFKFYKNTIMLKHFKE